MVLQGLVDDLLFSSSDSKHFSIEQRPKINETARDCHDLFRVKVQKVFQRELHTIDEVEEIEEMEDDDDGTSIILEDFFDSVSIRDIGRDTEPSESEGFTPTASPIEAKRKHKRSISSKVKQRVASMLGGILLTPTRKKNPTEFDSDDLIENTVAFY